MTNNNNLKSSDIHTLSHTNGIPPEFKTPMEYFKENCIKNEDEFSQML